MQRSPIHPIEEQDYCHSLDLIGKYLHYLHSSKIERELRGYRWRYLRSSGDNTSTSSENLRYFCLNLCSYSMLVEMWRWWRYLLYYYADGISERLVLSSLLGIQRISAEKTSEHIVFGRL